MEVIQENIRSTLNCNSREEEVSLSQMIVLLSHIQKKDSIRIIPPKSKSEVEKERGFRSPVYTVELTLHRTKNSSDMSFD